MFSPRARVIFNRCTLISNIKTIIFFIVHEKCVRSNQYHVKEHLIFLLSIYYKLGPECILDDNNINHAQISSLIDRGPPSNFS